MDRFTYRLVMSITVLILAAVFFAGCSADTIGIFQPNALAGLETLSSLTVIPIRREYPVDSVFNKGTDFTVLAVYSGGSTETLDPADVRVSIEDRGLIEALQEGKYVFDAPGEKVIAVFYEDKSARYAVWVRSETTDPGSNQGPDDGSTSIDIVITR